MTLSCILLALLAGAPSIPVAASGERLWVMEPSTDLKGHFDLAVQGPPGEPGTLTVVRRLAALPGSITGLEDTLWVDLLRTGDMPITDVLQVTARWSDAMGTWIATPSQGWDIVPSVICSGTPSLVATPGGLWLACLGERVTLHRLSGGRWIWVDLPDLPAATRWHLLGGPDRPSLLGQRADGESWLMRPTGEGGWSITLLPEVRIDLALASMGHIVLLAEDRGVLSCSRLLGNRIEPLADIDVEGSWGASVGGESIIVLDRGGSGGALQRRDINLPGGEVSAATALIVQQATPAGIWSLLTSVAIAAAVLAVLLMGRRGATAALLQTGPGLGMLRRLLAAGIDALPAGAGVVFAMSVAPAQLARLPLLGLDPARLDAVVIWALASGSWVFLWTAASGTTPGLRCAGGRIVDVDGGRCSAWAATRRGLLFAIVLVAPPLALLVLLGPGQLSLADMVSRTRAVDRRN